MLLVFSMEVQQISQLMKPYKEKLTATVPSTTFNKTADWNVLGIDTCSGLGNRTANPNQVTTIDFDIYPNPSNGNFTVYFTDLEKGYSIEIYSILGKKVFEKSAITTQNNTVSQLQSGVYLVKITKGSETVVKKVIVN